MTEKTEILHQAIISGARRAVANAIERHRRLGEPIVVWRDGKIVWIEAKDIEPQKLSVSVEQRESVKEKSTTE